MGKKGMKRDLFAFTQKAAIYNDKKEFLVVKVAEDQGGIEEYGWWDFPGGHVEHGEHNFKESLLREVHEEIGEAFECEVKDPFITQRKDADGNRRISSGVLVKYCGGDIKLTDGELTEYKWQTLEEIEEAEEYHEYIKELARAAHGIVEQLEAQEKMLRTLAEFDNYKKRSAESQKDFAAYASESVIMEMLPVLDNFHAATEHVPEDQKDSPWLTGIMFIQQQMDKVFEDQGVSEIAVNIGDAFDPETMEAVEQSSGGEKKTKDDSKKEKASSDKEKVVKIIQKGYKLKEKILRPARVVVE